MIFSRLLFKKNSHYFNWSKPVDLQNNLLGIYSVSNEILPLILADYFELYNVYDLKFIFLTLEMISTYWYKKIVSSDFVKLFSSYLLHWFHVWGAPKQTFLVLLFFYLLPFLLLLRMIFNNNKMRKQKRDKEISDYTKFKFIFRDSEMRVGCKQTAIVVKSWDHWGMLPYLYFLSPSSL